MAEIFLLIVFLLLLAFLALYERHKQTKDTLNTTEATLTAMKDKDKSLAKLPAEIERLKRENKKLTDNIVEAENALKEEREGLPKELQELLDEKDSLEKELSVTKKENDSIQEQLDDVGKKNTELRNQLSLKKGVDPPCWYQVVLRKGERHEKPYYLFDVAVHDEHISIRVNESVPLPGRAVDEVGESASTSYAEEYEKLQLTNLVNEKQILLTEFEAIAEPIKNMGKEGNIREYACVFYAKIWDFTSVTAKERWKLVHERVNDFYYTLLVKNDQWK